MSDTEKLLEKLTANINTQKRHLNQFYILSQKTITDIYRAQNYTTQVTAILSKINSQIGIYESLRKTVRDQQSSEKKKREYIQLINDIATEAQFLKATIKAMQDNYENLKKTSSIEQQINGSLNKLTKEAEKTLQKTELILHSF